MSVNLNNNVYYDDYDKSKGYLRILAIPDRVAQNREFNQIQSIFFDMLSRLGGMILKDGSIVSGCDVIISSEQVIVAPGEIYFDGVIFSVPEAILDIEGTGEETIGALVEEVIVTELQDQTLKDPAMGHSNFREPGAHRLKKSVRFVANDTAATVIFRIRDGVLYVDNPKPTLSVVNDLLARRTYDESGNYVVNGLTLGCEAYDQDYVTVIVHSGKAYVNGYEVTKPADWRIVIPKCTNYKSVVGEPKTFLTGTADYALNNLNAKVISRVTATVQVVSNINRGSTGGGSDLLPLTPVSSVISVVQGATTFTAGVDYQVLGNSISWSLAGLEPDPGSTYVVTWRYVKNMTPAVDYSLTFGPIYSYVTFLAGDKPVNASTFNIDYDFYLARKDLILLRDDGTILRKEGQPDLLGLVVTPSYYDNSALLLGYIYLPPNDTSATAASTSTTRVTMADIQKLVKRLGDMEYNQAVDDLDEEAMKGQVPTDLKGIFTDGFIGVTKADIFHEDFTAAFDFIKREITLPSTTTVYGVTPNVPLSSFHNFNRLLTAPFTEELVVSQTNASDSMLVNPYTIFNNGCVIKLTPSVDNWIDIDNIDISSSRVNTSFVRSWWIPRNDTRLDTDFTGALVVDTSETSVTNSTSVSRMILDEAVTFMRSIVLTVNCENFTAYADNIQCYFDGKPMTILPVAGTDPGTIPGTVKADQRGAFSFTFLIPPSTLTGSKEIRVFNDSNVGSQVFTSNGRFQRFETGVISVKDVTITTFYDLPVPEPIPDPDPIPVPEPRRPPRIWVDPLAQSFACDDSRLITSIDLFFSAKDTDVSQTVTIQLRNMVNGYPGVIAYAEKVLYPADITISANASAATHIVFDDPILCNGGELYCICVISASNKYALWTAILGKLDVLTSRLIVAQPYIVGVMFSSSNALTWTAHQIQDLKINIYAAKFTSNGTIYFNEVSPLTINRLMVAANYLTPRSTECAWDYKINEDAWSPIAAFDDIELSVIATKVSLRATLTATDIMSPLLSKDITNLIGFDPLLSGVYISKTVELAETYTSIIQSIEVSAPSGTAVRIYYSLDEGETWSEQINPTSETIDTEFSRLTFTKSNLDPSSSFKTKITLGTSISTVRPRVRKLMNIIK